MFENINLMELWDVIVRALVSLVVLFFVTKMIGKKQVSELSLFDYVIGISIGNFAAEISINLEADMLYGIVGVVIFGLVAYLVSILTMKSMTLRRFIMGSPTMLIKDGKIIFDGLKKIKYDVNDLLEACRISGYFDISKIECALMEANGTVSFLPKTEYQPVTNKDMNLKPKRETLLANVIIDGVILEKNLESMSKNKEWLLKQIKKHELDNIILCTLDDNNNIKLYLKDEIQGMEILE
ncbi:MAG: DUF421 domain-containing protein [Bacilli bacterium]|nr:DUF421 domain-containing protein [Bacilli bacterium]